MRHVFRLLTVTLTLTLLGGCSSKVELPPVAPEDVEVFLPGSLPKQDYKIMSRFEVRLGLQEPDQMLIDRARERAAQLGADAVVITAMRRTSEGGVDLNLSQEQEKILDALAVYYPSKHPELQNP